MEFRLIRTHSLLVSDVVELPDLKADDTRFIDRAKRPGLLLVLLSLDVLSRRLRFRFRFSFAAAAVGGDSVSEGVRSLAV